LQLCHRERGLEREVDVVAEQQIPGPGRRVEGCEAIAARPRAFEQVPVVRKIEGAAHFCAHFWARIQWNCTGPSGSVNVTTSSRRIARPAASTRRVFSGGS